MPHHFFILLIFITIFPFSTDKALEKENKEENRFNTTNDLKIEIYPENIKKNDLQKEPLNNLINKETHNYSFDPKRELAFINTSTPLLHGFYFAHINHLPIRIRPDDIWLLIIQAFSNHVNSNSEELRDYFVNFDGKKKLEFHYYINGPNININHLPKWVYEDFSIQITNQMEEYLGREILDTLTPDFTITNYDSTIICKLSIMGSFKKYFDYIMHVYICGNPYIILEGTEEDYKKIISKAEKLSKYKFEWYIDRIIPIINKFMEAKQGKIDIGFFQNIIQEKEVNENLEYDRMAQIKHILGWILKFFAYTNKKIVKQEKSKDSLRNL